MIISTAFKQHILSYIIYNSWCIFIECIVPVLDTDRSLLSVPSDIGAIWLSSSDQGKVKFRLLHIWDEKWDNDAVVCSHRCRFSSADLQRAGITHLLSHFLSHFLNTSQIIISVDSSSLLLMCLTNVHLVKVLHKLLSKRSSASD